MIDQKVYEYKGKFYVYEGMCKMKEPVSGKWVDAISYLRLGERYVREAKDFVKKFTPVPDDTSNPLRAGTDLQTNGI